MKLGMSRLAGQAAWQGGGGRLKQTSALQRPSLTCCAQIGRKCVSALPSGQAAPMRWIDGNPGQIANQLVGAGIGIALAVVGTLVALRITQWITPLRVEEREESTGMDLTLHGEEGYNLDT